MKLSASGCAMAPLTITFVAASVYAWEQHSSCSGSWNYAGWRRGRAQVISEMMDRNQSGTKQLPAGAQMRHILCAIQMHGQAVHVARYVVGCHVAYWGSMIEWVATLVGV